MEEPLPAGGSCLLGSINLSEFVNCSFTNNSHVNFEELEEVVVIAIRGLNQVLMEGMNLHPLEVQRKSVYDWRQIGLGTFGLGDMLIKLGIKYGSKESIDIINSVFKFIATTAVETSLQLAKVEGCYPMCNREALIESSFIKALNLPSNTIEDIRKYGLFNSQLLTCAPTGSIATMIEVSTGVEPNYAFSFIRRTVSLNKEETYYTVDANIVKQYKEFTKNNELPKYFVSSKDINYLDRLKVQATLQHWIDASISSTVNLPESTTIDEVFDIYVKAWELGLKGVTIWRDNCQRQGILTINNSNKEENKQVSDKLSDNTENAKELISISDKLKRGEVIPAGDHWLGLKRTLTTGCGTLHCTAYFDPNTGDLRECYLSKGSTGGCNNFMVGLSRMISLAARGGIGLEAILDQLKSCGVCPSYAVRSATKKDCSKGSCCPVAVGNALRDMYKEIQEIIREYNDGKDKELNAYHIPDVHILKPEETISEKYVSLDEIPRKEEQPLATKEYIQTFHKDSSLEECPNCHEKTLIHTGGCVSCPNCSWTRCS